MSDRAIFIDRDGTLNEEVGYITELTQFRLFDFAAEAVRLINDANWRAIVLTNQSGIARGLFDEEFLLRLHSRMEASLKLEGARLDAIYYCPHHPEFGEPPYHQDCNCRKPKPGLIERAMEDFQLDLKRSFVIGDRYRDVETGCRAGTRCVMVMTGHGREEFRTQRASPNGQGQWEQKGQPEHIAENLVEAVRWILSVS
jgi:D-glycero-D-manno-heptose 1,7-bisphosphate phosphatase